ncbi:MAG: acyl carrier protein [Lachnospiraceae bacterium]|nr:acyl carrier protein [Lachnospiraceae bacterium]
MDKDQIVKKLNEVIQAELPDIEEDVNLNASITQEYGVNSVSLIRLIVALEEKFDISFTDYELALSEYESFSDLVAVITEKLG